MKEERDPVARKLPDSGFVRQTTFQQRPQAHSRLTLACRARMFPGSSRTGNCHVEPWDRDHAIFLASDAAKSISGQMLPIDNDMQSTGG